MAQYGRDYGRRYDWQYRSSPGTRSAWGQPPDRLEPSYGYGYGYDYHFRDRTRPPAERSAWGFAPLDSRSGYGGDYTRDYGRGHKARSQTDYGDPFSDRIRGTHVRLVRSEPRDFDRRRLGVGYSSDYSPRWRSAYDGGYSTRGRPPYRGYDAYWF